MLVNLSRVLLATAILAKLYIHRLSISDNLYLPGATPPKRFERVGCLHRLEFGEWPANSVADCATDITNRRLADADAYHFTFDSDGGRIVDFLQLCCELGGVLFVYKRLSRFLVKSQS